MMRSIYRRKNVSDANMMMQLQTMQGTSRWSSLYLDQINILSEEAKTKKQRGRDARIPQKKLILGKILHHLQIEEKLICIYVSTSKLEEASDLSSILTCIYLIIICL